MKFKTKQVEIEAWREGCGEPMPEILYDMLVHGGLRLPRGRNGNVYNHQHKATISFNGGDWLIYSNGPDDVYPCTGSFKRIGGKKIMRINTEIIRALDPCKDRFDNYMKHYESFDGQIEDFIALDNITYSDKVWVAVRLMSCQQYARWAALCAQSVLHIFESRQPGDDRPRKAIDAALEGKSVEACHPASAAAYADVDAADAVRAAADAAADAARVAAYAAYAADAAAYADDAAYAAASAAAYAAYAAAGASADDAAYAAASAAHAAADAAAYAARAARVADTVQEKQEKQEIENLRLLVAVVKGGV